MPTIANLPASDLDVTFPSGETRTVNLLVMLAETQNAEMRSRHGVALARNAPSIAKLREKYELDWFFDARVRTWNDCAAVMRHVYDVFQDHCRQSA